MDSSGNVYTKYMSFIMSSLPKFARKMGTGPLPKPVPVAVDNPNYQEESSRRYDGIVHDETSHLVIQSLEDFMSVYDAFYNCLVHGKSLLEAGKLVQAYQELEPCVTYMDAISSCHVEDFQLDHDNYLIVKKIKDEVEKERKTLKAELGKKISEFHQNSSIDENPPSYNHVVAADLIYSLKKDAPQNQYSNDIPVSPQEESNDKNSQIAELESDFGFQQPHSSNLYDIPPRPVHIMQESSSSFLKSSPVALDNIENATYTPVYTQRTSSIHSNQSLERMLPKNDSQNRIHRKIDIKDTKQNKRNLVCPTPHPRYSKLESDDVTTDSIYQNIEEIHHRIDLTLVEANQDCTRPLPNKMAVKYQTGSDTENNSSMVSSNRGILHQSAESECNYEERGVDVNFEETLNKMGSSPLQTGGSQFYVRLQPTDYVLENNSKQNWNLVLELRRSRVYFIVNNSVLYPGRENLYIYRGDVLHADGHACMKMILGKSKTHQSHFFPNTKSLLTVTGYYIISTGDAIMAVKASSRVSISHLEGFEDILKYNGIFLKEQLSDEDENKPKKRDFSKSMSSLRDQAMLTTRRSFRRVKNLTIVKHFTKNDNDIPIDNTYQPPKVLEIKDEHLSKLQKTARLLEESVHNESIERI